MRSGDIDASTLVGRTITAATFEQGKAGFPPCDFVSLELTLDDGRELIVHASGFQSDVELDVDL